jgi:hypothetical protein
MAATIEMNHHPTCICSAASATSKNPTMAAATAKTIAMGGLFFPEAITSSNPPPIDLCPAKSTSAQKPDRLLR